MKKYLLTSMFAFSLIIGWAQSVETTESPLFHISPKLGGFSNPTYEVVGYSGGIEFGFKPKNISYTAQIMGFYEFVIFSEPYILGQFTVLAGKQKDFGKRFRLDYAAGLNFLTGKSGGPAGAKDFLVIATPGLSAEVGLAYRLTEHLYAEMDVHANANLQISLIIPTLSLSYSF